MSPTFSGGTIDGNILPSSTGHNLGSALQRWDAFLQDLDVNGTINFGSGSVATLGTLTLGNLNNTLFVGGPGGMYPTIDDAIATLPSAGGVVDASGLASGSTIPGFTLDKPAVVILSPGSFTLSGSILVTHRDASIVTRGFGSTELTYTGGGIGIDVSPTVWAVDDASGRIEGLVLIGNSGVGAAGIRISNVAGYELNRILVKDFTGSNSHGIMLRNTAGLWTERTILRDVATANCTRGLRFGVAGGTNSFGYTRIFNLKQNIGAGQFGILLEDNALLYNSIINVNANMTGASTLFGLYGTASIQQTWMVVEIEAASAGTNLVAVVDAGTVFNATGYFHPYAGNMAVTGAGTSNISNAYASLEQFVVGGVVRGKRLMGNGASLVAGDFALDANWGSGAAVSAVTGTDQAWQITVTAAGTPGANPTITLTFKDGTWTNAPICITKQVGGTGVLTNAITEVPAATANVITWNGTPVAASTYIFSGMAMGR